MFATSQVILILSSGQGQIQGDAVVCMPHHPSALLLFSADQTEWPQSFSFLIRPWAEAIQGGRLGKGKAAAHRVLVSPFNTCSLPAPPVWLSSAGWEQALEGGTCALPLLSLADTSEPQSHSCLVLASGRGCMESRLAGNTGGGDQVLPSSACSQPPGTSVEEVG